MPDETKAEDETKKADETAESDTLADETKKDESVDYDKELTEQVQKFELAEKNREGYAKRKEKKTTEESVDETVKELVNIEEKVAEAIKKQMPKLQLVALEDQIESGLDRLASTDAERKLIKFHFEHSVGTNGTIMERLENAKLIANKKTIFKTQKEMAVALQNRQGLSTTGQGSSTEGQQVKDSFLAADQIKDLKARGWDDKKIQRFKDNLRK